MTGSSQPDPHDRAVFAAGMRRFGPLDDADIAAALRLMRPRELARGEHFLLGGTMATEIAVVVRGLIREYFVMASGVERTKSFVLEGQPCGSFADLIAGIPSRAFVSAEEPSRLLVMTMQQFLALVQRSPAWAEAHRRSVERLLVIKAEREYELLGLDAEERYALFGERFPGLEARVAARHVASYLGITQVHLSRLRRRRRARSARR